MVNIYGTVFKIDRKPTDFVSDSLTHVGQNAVGIVFGGCLVAVAATDPAGDTVGGSLGEHLEAGCARVGQ